MEIKDEDLRKIETEMLIYIDNICSTLKIQYYLYAGTLLGAVRHKGFIPWDDDIDIALMRRDYERLKKALSKGKNKYKLLSEEQDTNYYLFSKLVDSSTILIENGLPRIKELGVYIDIFPLDHLPNNMIKRRLFQKKIHFLRILNTYSIFEFKNIEKKPVNIIIWIVAHFIKTKTLKGIIFRNINRCNKKESDYVDVIVAATDPERTVKKKWFEEVSQLQFQDNTYPVPKGYHEFLTELYGDYMILPSKDKQVSNHNFIAIYRGENE